MYIILLTAHFIVCFMLVGLILIQHGKGAQTGAAFGSGASQTVFGSQGSGGFLSRLTTGLAALFFVLNLILVYYINKQSHPRLLQEEPVPMQETTINKGSAPSPASSDVPEVD